MRLLVTRADQHFVMIQESDNVWRTAGLRNVFAASLAPIWKSEEAMKEYAKDNLKTEIERRKEVIDYFLKQQVRREALKAIQ